MGGTTERQVGEKYEAGSGTGVKSTAPSDQSRRQTSAKRFLAEHCDSEVSNGEQSMISATNTGASRTRSAKAKSHTSEHIQGYFEKKY